MIVLLDEDATSANAIKETEEPTVESVSAPHDLPEPLSAEPADFTISDDSKKVEIESLERRIGKNEEDSSGQNMETSEKGKTF